jgi:hypothetical protein
MKAEFSTVFSQEDINRMKRCEYVPFRVESPRKLRSLRFGPESLDDLRLEWGALAASCIAKGLSRKPQPSWMMLLPPFDTDPVGYERQVLAGLQLGLMTLGADRSMEFENIRQRIRTPDLESTG